LTPFGAPAAQDHRARARGCVVRAGGL